MVLEPRSSYSLRNRVTEYRTTAYSYEKHRFGVCELTAGPADDVSDLESVRWTDLSSIPPWSPNRPRTDAKPITEPFPIHVAAALHPISRLTVLRAACRSALLFQKNALYHAAVVIALSQAVSAEK